eukprot:CAMPEP_0205804490 /NCGR_PEP_ID=MMETSP0205-20121125/7419_1 /ASSEMBLY_ACC=CAM_ASM_000278 /TAXON_ID=36767 /ORGANISM="Euplotes focardii, Strain TN1" /LENGTH=283 /DNA_ID=CAMNT_0053074171 /DNA_START=8 /DNA_END=860 /DNA_ORIENTATION=-
MILIMYMYQMEPEKYPTDNINCIKLGPDTRFDKDLVTIPEANYDDIDYDMYQMEPEKYPTDNINCIKLGPDTRFDKDLVTIPEANYDDIDYVYVPEGLVKSRVERLAEQIFKDYAGPRENPLRIFVIMNGAFQFYTDLNDYLKKLGQYNKEKINYHTDFIKIKGYVNTETRLEEIAEECITESMVKDQDILVVEDIFDSGTLMSKLYRRINKHQPKTVEAAVLLHKENMKNLKHNFVAKYTGFSCPADKFVMGYGMDYNEYFRDLPHVCIITKEAIDKYFRDD